MVDLLNSNVLNFDTSKVYRLYTQEEHDRLIFAERDRWTSKLTERWHAGDGAGQTLQEYLGMSASEYEAWLKI